MNKFFNIDIKKKKFLKDFKIRKYTNKFSNKNLEMKKGNLGLQCLNSGILNSKHFKNLREYLSKNFKKECKFWINYYPNKGISKKSIGVRMGKGKGKTYTYCSYIKKGSILVELSDSINYYKAKKILKGCMLKLPLDLKFIKKKK